LLCKTFYKAIELVLLISTSSLHLIFDVQKKKWRPTWVWILAPPTARSLRRLMLLQSFDFWKNSSEWYFSIIGSQSAATSRSISLFWLPRSIRVLSWADPFHAIVAYSILFFIVIIDFVIIFDCLSYLKYLFKYIIL
jgi:hypothetical protein